MVVLKLSVKPKKPAFKALFALGNAPGYMQVPCSTIKLYPSSESLQ
jgi:hypothetical protein